MKQEKHSDSPYAAEIYRRMIETGIKSTAELTRRSNLSRSAVYDIFRGVSKNPRADTLTAIAKVLHCSIDDLTGEKIAALGNTPITAADSVYVVGAVEADVLLKFPRWPPDQWRSTNPPDIYPYPATKVFALEVRGQSMDKEYTGNNGSLIFCIETEDLIPYNRVPKTGDFVVCHRKVHEYVEVSCKQLELTPGNALLWPRSNSDMFQEPLKLPMKGGTFSKESDITVFALVVAYWFRY